MNLIEIQRVASENLRKTYFHLGLAIKETTLIKEQGFQAVLGEFEHPICNFAAGLNLDPWSAKQLVSLALSKKAFNVYALPGDEPEHVNELLLRNDFRVSYRLAQLVAPGEAAPIEKLPAMRRAESHETRYAIALFMTEQFFARQTEEFRQKVAQATSDAVDLELYDLSEGKHRIAAIMLCHSAHTIGIYNLCVAGPKRGLGIGRNLTRWARSMAHDQAKLATLQCDAGIQDWYEQQGFSRIGSIDVFTLSKTVRSDIMSIT